MGLISPREYIDLVVIRRNVDGGLYYSYGESCDFHVTLEGSHMTKVIM